MKNRFLGLVYVILFSLLVITAITQYAEKGTLVIWMSLALGALYLLPAMLERLLDIIIPPLLKYVILAFLFLCLHVGGIMSFYERFNGWDSFIHLISGCLTPALALSMINIQQESYVPQKPVTRIYLCFMFLLQQVQALYGSISNFSATPFRNQPSERHNFDNGQVDIGLIDTMTDLLFSQSASLLTSFCLYRAIKKDRWLSISRILITREEK